MQQIADPDRIRENLRTMQSKGATKEQMQSYLAMEKARASEASPAPKGSAPANSKPTPTPQPAPASTPEEAFAPPPAAQENTTPSYTPDDQRILNESLQDDLKAYFEDQHAVGTLTAEGLQDYFKTISGGRLQIADPQASVDNFKKFGWNGVVYGGGNKPAPDGSEPAPQAQTPPEEPKGPVQNVAVRQLGALNEGIADTLGFPVDLVNAGLAGLDWGADKLIGDDGIRLSSDKPFLGSDSIRSGMRSLGMGQVDESYAPQNGFEDYSQAFFRGVGQTAVPVLSTMSAGGRLANQGFQAATKQSALKRVLADDAITAFKRPRGTIAAELGTSTGANLGGELADDIAPDNPYVKTALTLAGGAGGGASANAVSKRATPNRRAELWVEKVLEKDGNNAALPHLPEVAEDLFTVTKGTVGFEKATPKGRAQITVKQINDLEDRYLSDIAGRLDKLPNLEPAQRQYLKEAIKGKHSLDGLNVDLLRGTPEGDFVADAIIRTQTLRAATPEVPRKSALPFAREAGALMSGGGVFAMDGGIASLPAYGLARYMLSRVGNTEAARVHSAENMVSNIERYRKLAEQVGPSTYQGNRDLFMRMSDEAMNEKWLAKKAKEAEAKDEAIVQSMYSGEADPLDQLPAFLKGTVKPSMSNASKLVRQQESAAAKLQKELDGIDKKAVAEQKAAERGYEKGLKAETKQVRSDFAEMAKKAETAKTAAERLIGASRKKAEGWQTKFDKATATKPVKVDPKDAAIQKNIEEGFEGTSRVQQSFAERVGVPEADMLRALDQVAGEFPELADDIKRIQFKYPTKTRGLADILVPRMKAVLEQDGTMAKVKEQAAAATERATAKRKLANPDAAPVTTAAPQPTRAAEGDMVGISRPEQWEAGKAKYQAQADQGIDRLFKDETITDNTYKVIGNAPEQIRDNFRTAEEAKEYIREVVLPDLEISGVDPSEIATVRSYLFDIASAKPYATKAEYEAGTKKKQ